MAALNTRPQTPAPAPASYEPSPADVDELLRVAALHDALRLCPDMPPELRWALLDFAAGVLAGDRRATSAADRAA